ncbi:helix-turn-helix domain-containing protein [Streptomyces lunaelactis]|nr:helix-turn-helix domain-containing protein [Streptomyces lunaelactis]
MERSRGHGELGGGDGAEVAQDRALPRHHAHRGRTRPFTLRAPWGLDVLAEADTIILPGCADPTVPVPPEALDALRAAAARGTRIASICAGAFVFAATGLLDGLRATTHWVLTSAGAAAGLDLCLHMIRRDHGSAVAADAARLSVMPLEREGGQGQFIVHEQPPSPDGAPLEPLLRWMEENAGRELTVGEIAAHAGMSPRTLNRRFREQTATTPVRWLHRARIRQAQYLLETTAHAVDRIATQVGFGSPTAFRDRFKRQVGTSPHAYRRAFQGSPEPQRI